MEERAGERRCLFAHYTNPTSDTPPQPCVNLRPSKFQHGLAGAPPLLHLNGGEGRGEEVLICSLYKPNVRYASSPLRLHAISDQIRPQKLPCAGKRACVDS